MSISNNLRCGIGPAISTKLLVGPKHQLAFDSCEILEFPYDPTIIGCLMGLLALLPVLILPPSYPMDDINICNSCLNLLEK